MLDCVWSLPLKAQAHSTCKQELLDSLNEAGVSSLQQCLRHVFVWAWTNCPPTDLLKPAPCNPCNPCNQERWRASKLPWRWPSRPMTASFLSPTTKQRISGSYLLQLPKCALSQQVRHRRWGWRSCLYRTLWGRASMELVFRRCI
jgi:hypothetical protein